MLCIPNIWGRGYTWSHLEVYKPVTASYPSSNLPPSCRPRNLTSAHKPLISDLHGTLVRLTGTPRPPITTNFKQKPALKWRGRGCGRDGRGLGQGEHSEFCSSVSLSRPNFFFHSSGARPIKLTFTFPFHFVLFHSILPLLVNHFPTLAR